MADKIILTNCKFYIEDTSMCDDEGKPKGQCGRCGCKWYEHKLGALFGADYESAKQIQAERGTF